MREHGVSGELPAGESLDVLQRLILPTFTKGAVRQDQPVVVIVAGQPGAGKTEVADLVQAALGHRGKAVRVCRDLYKSAHREYASILAADIRTAGLKVRPDTSRWQAQVEERVRACRFDAVVESALADASEFRASSVAYRRSGHRIEIVVVATGEAWSQLGILDRLLTGAACGEGAQYVAWDNLDTCVTQLPKTLAVIETEHLADRITVVRRDATVLCWSVPWTGPATRLARWPQGPDRAALPAFVLTRAEPRRARQRRPQTQPAHRHRQRGAPLPPPLRGARPRLPPRRPRQGPGPGRHHQPPARARHHGDFAYFTDIAHYMGTLPLPEPSTTRWTRSEDDVRSTWRGLVQARQEHLRTGN